jgi:hypothetical protein
LKNYKEKEMADFRKWILALTVMALFAGLAAAQNPTNISCTNASVNVPQLRSEGFTELVGDILLACTGPVQAAGTVTNITVYLNGTITSRLLPTSTFGTGSIGGGTPSEILLLLDDPSSATLSGAPAQSPCTSPNAGAGVGGCSAGSNVFQGVLNAGGASVTFYGVPVLPPTTNYVSGVATSPAAANGVWYYRVVNVRMNANGTSGGGSVPFTALAYISSLALPPVNGFPVGIVGTSLSTSVSGPLSSSGNPFSAQQCNSFSTGGIATLGFSEIQGQGNAFKPRVATNQSPSVPGVAYNTESGFIPNTGVFNISSFAGGTTPGLADFGTRLKAVFTNIPSGVTLYVSTLNLVNGNTEAVNSNTTATSYAVLVSTFQDNQVGAQNGATPPVAIPPNALTATGQLSSGQHYVALPVNGSTATAVWEVINSIPNAPETLYFGVFASWSANGPTSGAMSVTMSYAPTPSGGGFTAATGAVASSTLPEPRFNDTGTAKTALSISICQTALLFPYVINTNGFDTGLAIANTTTDPFGTAPQSGYCTLNWYGTGTPATNPGFLGNAGYQTTTPTSSQMIASGTIQAWGTSVAAPGFSGYVIAVCNFQYAHGFAFVSDLGARNLAMGYLADIINGSIGVSRAKAPTASEANGQ